MILGAVCTRACRFCAVKTGLPNELDLNEPERVAESVELMNLKHVVITAVARDDFRRCGSNVYAETVRKYVNVIHSLQLKSYHQTWW